MKNNNSTAKTVAWGASFIGTTLVPLPSTTVISTTLRIVFQCDGTDWVSISVV